MAERRNASPEPAPRPGGRLRQRLVEALGDDAERLRAFAGRTFPGWTV